jgi:hypothetical protein
MSSPGNSPSTNPLGYSGILPSNPPNQIISNRDPISTDINANIGDEWQNRSVNPARIWKLGNLFYNVATWELITSGGDVIGLEGNNGGIITPNSSGTIHVVGDGTTVNISGDAGTNTLTVSAVGEVISLEGNTGGTVPPSGSGVIHVVGDGMTVEITGNPGTNTLTVSTLGSDVLNSLSDDSGTVIDPSSGNIQLVGHVNEQGSTKFSTVVAGSNLANINPMSPSRWIVDNLGFNGTHTTIPAALASATAGDTVIVLPGTFTGNFTLKNGVNIVGIGNNQGISGNVIINGEITDNGTPLDCTLTGLTLRATSNYAVSITGASSIVLDKCYVYALTNTAIFMNHASANLILENTDGEITNTGLAFFTVQNGDIWFYECAISNPGLSSTLSTIGPAGAMIAYSSQFQFPISTSGNGVIGTPTFLTIESCIFDTTDTNSIAVTTAGTMGNYIYNSLISSGTASSVSIGSGTTMNLNGVTINSSATNAIAGLGTLVFGGLTFTGTSSQVDSGLTLTLNGYAPSNAPAGYILTSTGPNTPPTWQAP